MREKHLNVHWIQSHRFETNFHSGTTAAYINNVNLYYRYGFLNNRSWPIIYLGFILLLEKCSLGHARKNVFHDTQ